MNRTNSTRPAPDRTGFEKQRVLALVREDLLDTQAEPGFDAMVRIAAQVCETPYAMFSLIDERRQWFKAAHGVAQGSETPREYAFCEHAIRRPDGVFEVQDALQDDRFMDNPLVVGEMGIRFYAGVPVRSDTGLPLGTICVCDRKPGRLTDAQRQTLQDIAISIETLMLMRRLHLQTAVRLSSVYVETPALLFLLDESGAIVEASNLWLRHFGYERGEVIGRNARDFMSPNSRERFRKVRDRLWRRGGCHDYPCQFQTAAGQIVDTLVSAEIERDAVGQTVQIKCVLTDVSRQVKLQNALKDKARIDEMTGIPNRAWFRERMRVEMSRASRHHRPLSLVMFDADRFKEINDTYGHATGDRALVVLANQARLQLRGSDEVGRIGGEEFALLLPETPLSGAEQVAERLRASIANLDLPAMLLPCSLSVSLGVTLVEEGMSMAEAFGRADAAMYAAKRAGRNQVVVWSEDLPGDRQPLENRTLLG